MTRRKWFRIGLWALIGVFAGTAVALTVMRDDSPATSEAAYGTPFALVDQNGAPVTQDAFRGKPTAVFFGFTHCPEVCPTALYELGGYQSALKKAGKTLQLAFVTVDPERDTPEVMRNYVGAISPDILAITGAPDKIAAMLKGWGVYWKKVGTGPDYTMDHTATTFLLDPDGRFVGTIAYGEDSRTAMEKLERLATS